MLSIFEKWMFFSCFYLISASIFHLIFLKNEIKTEIKNGSKMGTVNTPNYIDYGSSCVHNVFHSIETSFRHRFSSEGFYQGFQRVIQAALYL